jgi:hypothetical protein
MDSKSKTAGYWVVTGLFCAVYTVSALGDLLQLSPMKETLAHLGYPAYVATILGPWKALAVLALLAPGLQRVKEWAYAGAVFDLTGGLASHLFSGDPLPKPLLPVVMLALLVSSYLLRPTARVLGSPLLPIRSAARELPKTAQTA